MSSWRWQHLARGSFNYELHTSLLLVTRLQTISSLPCPQPSILETWRKLSVLEKNIQSCHITAEADFVTENISFCTKEDNDSAACFNDSSHPILKPETTRYLHGWQTPCSQNYPQSQSHQPSSGVQPGKGLTADAIDKKQSQPLVPGKDTHPCPEHFT